jgi:2'-5' RNA ligase
MLKIASKKIMKTKRLFAAIKVQPDPNLISIYNNLKSALRHEKINWVSEKNIHITLKFFGETPEDKIDEICEVFDNIAARHQPFNLTLENIGIFGSSYEPRVIWFGMAKSEAVEKLAEEVLLRLKTIGFEPDGQHFRPHLTIGRIKQIISKKQFQQTIDTFKNTFIQDVQVDDFELIESILKPQGPVYQVIESFNLDG